MEPHPILQSLLATSTSTTTTTTTGYGVRGLSSSPAKSVSPSIILKLPGIYFRVVLISFIGIVALWANYEASKGFSITIVNDANRSLSGKRFALFYESNDKASRIVLNTSTFVESILYPNENFTHAKKQINSVTVRLAPTNIPSIVSVDSPKPHEFTITLSPSLMESYSNNAAVQLAVLKGMARVWFWDGNKATPQLLLDGMVEYMSNLAGFTITKVLKSSNDATMSQEKSEVCWKDKDPRKVARFLRYCDQIKREAGGGGGGEVIRRLNERMRNEWHDRMMDDALNMSGQHACATYHMKMLNDYPSSSM